MKGNMYTTLVLAACLFAGCGMTSRGDISSDESASGTMQKRRPTATVYDEERSVTLHDPYLQNAEALTINCLPGWQLVGKMDIEEFRQSNGSISFQIKGSDGARQLGFYTELCRPYDRERCGLNLGEAAGAVVLASGPEYMPSCAVISGGSISDDANHISGPSRTGDALYFAMRDAMEEAGTSPSDVSFVSLHGTATVYNDEMESKAVSLAGLSGTPVQSLKPYIGHTLGASGVVESILCIRQLLSGEVWGTPGYNESGVPLPLDVSDCTRQVAMRHCVKTASGFGGCNAAAVFSLPEYAPDTCIGKPAGYAVIRHVRLDGQSLFHASSGAGDFHSAIREKYRSMGLDDMKFYKMDDMSKLGYIACHMLLEGLQFLLPHSHSA